MEGPTFQYQKGMIGKAILKYLLYYTV